MLSAFNRREEARLRRLAEGIYPTPCPWDTEEQYRKFHNLDVPQMDVAQVESELRQAEISVQINPSPDPWILEIRIPALRKALRRAR